MYKSLNSDGLKIVLPKMKEWNVKIDISGDIFYKSSINETN